MDLKQDRLSELARIPVSTLSQIENGRMAVDMEQLYRIAAAFNTTPDELIAAATRNAPNYQAPESTRDVGPLVTSTGSVTGKSTEAEHERIEEWSRKRRTPARGSNSPNPPDAEASSTGNQ